MATKKQQQAATDWEHATPSFTNDDFDILPSGLPPLWKPVAGDVIHFRPDHVEPFKQKKQKKAKKGAITKQNYAIAGTLVGGSTNHFFNGKNATEVKIGDRVTVGSN
jgi:hypothetical protein